MDPMGLGVTINTKYSLLKQTKQLLLVTFKELKLDRSTEHTEGETNVEVEIVIWISKIKNKQ